MGRQKLILLLLQNYLSPALQISDLRLIISEDPKTFDTRRFKIFQRIIYFRLLGLIFVMHLHNLLVVKISSHFTSLS